MGTTVTGLYWLRDRVAIVHVGDSRAYQLREGELWQITHDHTYVQRLIDAGRITEEEALVHPRRSVITRALDGLAPVEADLSLREVRDGDRFLICTDGLSGVVSADEIGTILADGDPTGAVTRLVDLALERGAPDNVTVVVADVVESAEPDAPMPPVVVGAAGEPRVRLRLPGIRFPDDAQPDPDRPDVPPAVDHGPPTAPQPAVRAELPPRAERTAADDSEARHRRRRIRRRIGWIAALVVVLVAVVIAAVLVARAWVSQQWYVALNGSAGTGTVAIYQGLPGTLVGVPLSSMSSDSGLQVGTLPLFDQELVSKGIPAADEADAQRIVSELLGRSAQCQTDVPPAGCPGTAP
jgi:protein phosphatase